MTPEKIVSDMKRWELSFLDFLFECIKTTDEGSGEVKPAPRFRYLKECADVIQDVKNKHVIVVKGRQMFFTHFMAAFYLWNVLFKENVRLGVMNQNEEKAADLVETRIAPLYDRLPEGYPWPKLTIKRLTIVNETCNSRILAVSSTSDSLRSYTFTIIWLDEFGFQENQEKTLRAAMAAVKGLLGKLVIVSTPVPKTLYEDLAKKELDVRVEPVYRMEGVTQYRNTRDHCVLYVHHSADPSRRSQEWVEHTKKTEGELAYEVEYNLKWILPVGKPVFDGFKRETYCRDYKGLLEGVRYEFGWDFGGHHPAFVAGQRDTVGRLHVHRAVMGFDVDLYEFMDRIEELLESEFDGWRENSAFYCDPAGAAVNGQGTAPPAQLILSKRFSKTVRSIKSSPADRVRAIKQLMGKLIGGTPGLVLHPMLGDVWYPDGKVESGMMIEGFETGLVYDELRGQSNKGIYKLTYKKDQWYEHVFDAFGYMFIYLYPGLMPMDFEARMLARQEMVKQDGERRRARARARARR